MAKVGDICFIISLNCKKLKFWRIYLDLASSPFSLLLSHDSHEPIGRLDFPAKSVAAILPSIKRIIDEYFQGSDRVRMRQDIIN